MQQKIAKLFRATRAPAHFLLNTRFAAAMTLLTTRPIR
jgi:hypothetical protein